MKKPTLTAMLTAGLMATGGFVYAQEAQLKVDKQSDNRAVISIDENASQRQQMGERVMQDHSVSGTVIPLETYLRDGEQAARGASASGMDPMAPKAILADDGQLYVLLGMSDASRSAMMDSDRTRTDRRVSTDDSLEVAEGDASARVDTSADRVATRTSTTATTSGSADDDDMAAHESPGYRTEGKHEPATDPGLQATASDSDGTLGMADSDTSARTTTTTRTTEVQQSPGYELKTDADADADGTVSVQADADVDTTARIDREVGNDLSPAPGRERHTHKADLSAKDERQVSRDADRDVTVRTQRSGDSDVYGYAGSSSSQQQLRVGEKVRVTGDVYERNGLRGIEVSNVSRM